MARSVGLLVILGGVCLMLIGLLVYSGAFNWFGRLPGDIRNGGTTTRIYFPIVSLLIISLVFNVILYLLRKFL